MKKIAILFICFIFSNLACFSANWIEFGYKSYYDVSTYKRNSLDSSVSVWRKELNYNNMFKPINNKKIWYTISKNIFYCATRTLKIEALHFYDMQGSAVKSLYSLPSDDIVPGTIGEYQYQYFCGSY